MHPPTRGEIAVKISNLKSVLGFLATAKDSMLVSSVGDDFIIVTPSDDADLLIKLRGVTGITVGSKISVDTTTGKVVVLEAAVAAAVAEPAKKKATPARGCNDRSFIAQ